jgi:hypothetical protein
MAIRSIAMLMQLTVSLCLAHESGEFEPATSKVLDAQFPKVDNAQIRHVISGSREGVV